MISIVTIHFNFCLRLKTCKKQLPFPSVILAYNFIGHEKTEITGPDVY